MEKVAEGRMGGQQQWSKSPLTLALSLREREYFDALAVDQSLIGFSYAGFKRTQKKPGAYFAHGLYYTL